MSNEHHNRLARECYHRIKHKHKDKRKAYNTQRKQILKEKAVAYKGGCCSVCGGVFPPYVYDFHHLDPSLKDYEPSAALDRKWERAAEELDKCVLVCANCHRTLHHQLKESNE